MNQESVEVHARPGATSRRDRPSRGAAATGGARGLAMGGGDIGWWIAASFVLVISGLDSQAATSSRSRHHPFVTGE